MTVVQLDDARRKRQYEATNFFSASSAPKLINDASISWIDDIIADLDELLQLNEGWDGYQARAIPFATAVFTLEILKAVCRGDTDRPDIMPGSGGDLLVEWERGRKILEAHVRGPNDFIIYRRDDESGLEDEIPLRNDVSDLASWLDWLSEDGGDVGSAAAG